MLENCKRKSLLLGLKIYKSDKFIHFFLCSNWQIRSSGICSDQVDPIWEGSKICRKACSKFLLDDIAEVYH